MRTSAGSRCYGSPTRPSTGRWVTRDPIGARGGLNLYSYDKSAPIGNLDRTGLRQGSPFPPGYIEGWNRLFQNAVESAQLRTRSWAHALGFLGDFLTGHGSDDRKYGAGSVEAMDIMNSRLGDKIRCDIAAFPPGAPIGAIIKGKVESPEAFANTLLQPFSGTQAQLGGAKYQLTNMGGGYALVVIYNEAGLNSFMYHSTSWLLPDYSRSTFGPMSKITQHISYVDHN